MLPLIPALSQNYRVLAPDLPGHGGTQATGHAHGADFLGTWLVEFVRATCDGPAVLVGNSLGGRTSLQAALDSPADVRGLVLLCPAVAFRRLRQFVPLVRLVRDELGVLPFPLPRAFAMRGLRKLFADPSRMPQAWLDAAIDEFLRVLSIRSNRMSTFSALRHIYLDEPFGGSGFWDRLPGLEPPALFVWGENDPLVPAGFAPFVTDALPDAHSVVIADCGHAPQFEYPELTAKLTTEFIAALPEITEQARKSR
jgi:pimeloyl-ACP methyl ester carboxylesterase